MHFEFFHFMLYWLCYLGGVDISEEAWMSGLNQRFTKPSSL